MPEFKISRFAYTWRRTWTTGTAYIKDDIVRYGGATWVCIRAHTAAADFYTDIEYVAPGETAASPAWVKMTDGFNWRNIWTSATKYAEADIVIYGGRVYICTQHHTSQSTFDANIADWAVYSESISWDGDWQAATRYGIGDLVRYNGIVYECLEGHTSANTTNGLEADQSKWQIFFSNIDFQGDYASDTRYRVNDLVKYGGSIFRCTSGHTSAAEGIDNSKFTIEFPGFNFSDRWDATTYYAQGDLVVHGGYIYYSKTNNYGVNPDEDQYVSGVNWEVLSRAARFRGNWSSAETYSTGDVVRRGGQLYMAVSDSTADGSTLDYLDAGNWEIIIAGEAWKDYWREDQRYAVGDVVIFDGNAYRCIVEHDSTDQNFPGDNGSGFTYFELLLQAGPNVGLRQKGDLLTYDLSRELQGDGSSFGPTAVEIGLPAQILTVNSEDKLFYKSFNITHRDLYVAPDGIDEPTRGLSQFDPFKTVRYAAEIADDGYQGTTTINVSAGVFEEILPIIIPKKTVILGSELRTTIIRANSPIPALANDPQYTVDILNRFRNIVDDVILGDAITPTIGNTEPQVILDEFGNESTVTFAQARIQDMINFIDFYTIGNAQEEPTVSGSNTPSIDINVLSAMAMLEANKEFFAEEAVAFMNLFYPQYDFDSDLCRRDVRRYIDAIIYDLNYGGNYKSVMAARYYRNAVIGSQLEDMFYCRDTTGVRNCTLEGLEGELSPPNVYGLFRRPTGGAYISLDPGWGPDDERGWIINRSPYIQGVTTFGYAAIGQKVDGALHNGGNKSITSNDFTQVISDGIGAWILNNGRVEMVSVFTYYSQVGYLAEDGGVIRATNGNNSYGRYGAMAVGNDPSETPFYGTVNNRNQHAQINNAFAGEVNDEILAIEFDNAGQNYTFANWSFIGSGINAQVIQDDFRDKGCFEFKLRNPQDSSVPGGSGYTVNQNNAQAGDEDSIVIATSDENEEANYLGMRIIITSGTGTGQYGIVNSYNTLTKVITVRRESTGELGWDHVIPGYPIANPLDSSTTYRIEPRPIFNTPETETASITLPISATWGAIAFGNTTESYINLEAPLGEGETIEILPEPAYFNVLKEGRTYTVTMVAAGAGYAVGQVLTLSGDDLGGTTPDNDVLITVTAITEDSTSAIVSFTYEGVAASGRFVITPRTGTSGVASLDGENWVDSTLPVSRDWKCLAAGMNMFVAIGRGSASAASSLNGVNWTARSIVSRNWESVCFGDDRFVAVASNLDTAAYSTNGTSWTAVTIPDLGDSSTNEWVDVCYGKGMFLAVANSNNAYAKSTDGGATWTTGIMDAVADSSQKDWVSVAYGNNRFVAMSSQGDVAYSFDGILWYGASMPSPDGSSIMNWKQMKYANGLFFAVCDTGGALLFGDPTSGPTRYSATSYDGIIWTAVNLEQTENWSLIGYGAPDLTLNDSTKRDLTNNKPTWLAIAGGESINNQVCKVHTGTAPRGRLTVASGRIGGVRIWEPGSGFTELNPPQVVDIIDPNAGTAPFFEGRIGDGVLAQPSWINRGLGYKTSTTRVTITGDGFADVIPANRYVTISGLTRHPGPGAQLRFANNSTLYTAVVLTPLNSTVTDEGGFSVYVQINPNFDVTNGPDHRDQVEIRERYSQCRITGHDFLDIGTGNFEETNYPELYATGDYIKAPENEIVEFDGGRVFYTSTDQDGNFRTGELFAVEQATGVVTISADYFDLNGLSELRLGGIRVGGSGVVIREFSSDPLFTEDSNNVVPTQRAIKTYLANRLSVGGSDIATASLIAGVVRVGPGQFNNTIGGSVLFNVRADFQGDQAGVNGMLLAQTMFAKSFRPR